jgi:hypothetical protein
MKEGHLCGQINALKQQVSSKEGIRLFVVVVVIVIVHLTQ